ncbi:hypothetical protein GCM10009657_10780 [Oryzihumus leptocrescens]
MLEGLQVLGRALPGVQPGLVTGGAVTHELHVGLGLGHLTLHVAVRGAGPDELAVQGAGLHLQRGQLLQLRERGLAVRDLVEARVQRLQVEQSPLTAGVGFQDVPPGDSAPTTKSQGSVRSVEM